MLRFAMIAIAAMASLALPLAAQATPSGHDIQFNMSGSFCNQSHNPPCIDASATLEGLINYQGKFEWLTHVSGELTIGSSPFAKTTYNLNVKTPEGDRGNDYVDPLFQDCVDNERSMSA